MNLIQKLIQGGFGWAIRDVFWRMDWRKPSKESIKEYLQCNVTQVRRLMAQKKLPTFSKRKYTRDEIAAKVYTWIVTNIKYKTDEQAFGVREKWESMDTIIMRKTADCESMASLFLAMCEAHGINKLQLRLAAGDVGGGHAWAEYIRDKELEKGQFTFRVYDPAMRTMRTKSGDYALTWFTVGTFEVKE